MHHIVHHHDLAGGPINRFFTSLQCSDKKETMTAIFSSVVYK